MTSEGGSRDCGSMAEREVLDLRRVSGDDGVVEGGRDPASSAPWKETKDFGIVALARCAFVRREEGVI